MQIHKNKSLAQPIGLALFVFFGAFVLSAFVSHSFTPVGDSSALDSEVSVEIEPSLSLAIMDKDPSNLSNGEVASTIGTMSMEVTPNASGVFISSTAYVVAGSNNETGYTLSFSDTDNNTALTNTDPAVTTNIPSISAASSSLTDITTNQWGYAFNTDTVFSPIPALSSPVTLASTTVPSSSVYPFTTASKIDMNVPSGVYQDSLVFSLVANYVAPKNYLQDMTLATCQSLPLNEQQIYIDRRDNKKYTIAKLADGNCWMTQNLRLGSGKEITLTPADSNVSSNFTLPKAPTTTSQWVNSTSTGAGSSQDAGTVDQIHLYDTNDADYGVYYNWFTATASTGVYEMTSGTASSSICPKGWRLPAGGASGDFQTLYTAESNNYNSFTSNGSWTLTGYYYARGQVNDQGSYAVWWSSTPYPDGFNAYDLRINTTVVSPQYMAAKANGLSVRCIYQPNLSDISTMQEMTANICAATNIGVSSTLTDTRDNETYTVKKLADGKCWMTQNLRLARSKAITLTNTDSDVSSNFSLPIAPTTTSSWGSYNVASDINTTHLYNTQNDSYGVYYNWYAATAGTGTYTMTSGTASSSICPKGWRLPTGGASGDFQALYTAEGSDTATFTSDGAWVLSGYYDSSARNQGSDGGWWSSTPSSDTLSTYRLSIESSGVHTQVYGYKIVGRSVRCLAR